MTDTQARARAAACVRVPGAHAYGRVGEASNMALERPAWLAFAHRRRSPPTLCALREVVKAMGYNRRRRQIGGGLHE
jgi:hypothetical protein